MDFVYFFKKDSSLFLKGFCILFLKVFCILFLKVYYSMYLVIFLISLLKSMEDLFKKNILKTLNHEEFLLIKTLSIAFVISSYVMYMYYNNFSSIDFTKISSLSQGQIISFVVLAVTAMISSVSIIKLTETMNSQVLYSLIKTTTVLISILSGIVFFGEKYTEKQI